MTHTELLHQCLLGVRPFIEGPSAKKSDRRCGICYAVEYAAGIESDNSRSMLYELRCLFEEWPEFSGEPDFPVPHPDGPDADDGWSSAAEAAYMGTEDLWLGEYGAARWRLLDWLIERTAPRAAE